MRNLNLKILFLLFTTILYSCNNDSPDIHANTPGDITYVSSISTTDIFDQPTGIYSKGETIRVRLSISSNATQDISLKFETYELYDLYIENELGVEV